jgi:hypothetical protein
MKIYFCNICKRWWERSYLGISCLVRHPEGTCCHYMEKEITDWDVVEVIG